MLTSNMELKETYRLAFPDIPNPSYTHVSYGLDFPGACAKHVESTFKCKRAYIIASNSLAKNTDYLRTLQDAMGENLAGTWIASNHVPPWMISCHSWRT
jgi:hypothetical protein